MDAHKRLQRTISFSRCRCKFSRQPPLWQHKKSPLISFSLLFRFSRHGEAAAVSVQLSDRCRLEIAPDTRQETILMTSRIIHAVFFFFFLNSAHMRGNKKRRKWLLGHFPQSSDAVSYLGGEAWSEFILDGRESDESAVAQRAGTYYTYHFTAKEWWGEAKGAKQRLALRERVIATQ